MERVAFITSELGDDLIVSFAVEKPGEPGEVESLILLRTMKYEHLLLPEERGVSVSFDRFRDVDDRDLLQEVRYSESEMTVHIETNLRSYDLDVRKVDDDELAEMRKVFHRMNRDGPLHGSRNCRRISLQVEISPCRP
jgi:hypothetical protein